MRSARRNEGGRLYTFKHGLEIVVGHGRILVHGDRLVGAETLRDPLAAHQELVQPALLRHEIRSTTQSQTTIAAARFIAARILAGQDDRVIVVVGPCSIHSAEQAIEYAHLLRAKMPSWPNLHIVMRAYL